jgi:hypothetical protein
MENHHERKCKSILTFKLHWSDYNSDQLRIHTVSTVSAFSFQVNVGCGGIDAFAPRFGK